MAGIARRLGLIAAGLCVVAGRAIAQDPPAVPSPQPSGSPGAIAGVVLKSPGGDPAAGASVRVLDEPFAGAPPGARTQTVTAAPDGSFAIDGLGPGNYWIVANVTVALVPYGTRRARFDLYRNATSDAAGRFRIPDVPPGDYTAVAFDGVESGEWQSAEFVAPYEGRGKPVRVVDGAPASVELIALPPAR